MMSRVEEILLKTSQFFKSAKRRAFFTNTFFAGLALVGAAVLSVSAQSGAMSPYQGESDGVSAGGKWLAFRSEDKMTGAKKVRFELLADNYFREERFAYTAEIEWKRPRAGRRTRAGKTRR